MSADASLGARLLELVTASGSSPSRAGLLVRTSAELHADRDATDRLYHSLIRESQALTASGDASPEAISAGAFMTGVALGVILGRNET